MPPKIIFRTLNRLHIFIYRASKGRILGRIVGSPVLLITTTGRKTGKSRTVPIVHLYTGNSYVVIASDHPAWHKNLTGNPQAVIEVRGKTYTVTARDAQDDEAAALWEKIVAQSPAFERFKGHPDHQLVVLETVNQP